MGRLYLRVGKISQSLSLVAQSPLTANCKSGTVTNTTTRICRHQRRSSCQSDEWISISMMYPRQAKDIVLWSVWIELQLNVHSFNIGDNLMK